MSKKSHVFMGNNSVRCFNCGEEQKFAPAEGGGFDLNVMIGTCKGFDKTHRKCKPTERGKNRFVYKTADEWADSWDTGTSSMAIYAFMTTGSRRMPSAFPEPPCDPSDFGRCYRLLAVAPQWRARLPEMAVRYPAWKPMIDAWDELTALYEVEIQAQDGMAPRLYRRMQALR